MTETILGTSNEAYSRATSQGFANRISLMSHIPMLSKRCIKEQFYNELCEFVRRKLNAYAKRTCNLPDASELLTEVTSIANEDKKILSIKFGYSDITNHRIEVLKLALSGIEQQQFKDEAKMFDRLNLIFKGLGITHGELRDLQEGRLEGIQYIWPTDRPGSSVLRG